jgi:hypothetical protein
VLHRRAAGDRPPRGGEPPAKSRFQARGVSRRASSKPYSSSPGAGFDAAAPNPFAGVAAAAAANVVVFAAASPGGDPHQLPAFLHVPSPPQLAAADSAAAAAPAAHLTTHRAGSFRSPSLAE